MLYLFVATVCSSDIRVHRFRLPLIPYLIINFVESVVTANVSLLKTFQTSDVKGR